jgi:DNA (cytosine-5)-methyltransferase 1
MTSRPPYRVPSMAAIHAVPWNGYEVVSTFSGCGGSCLGFQMAGFRVLWANEFIPAAQQTYRANHPTTILNTADIRSLQPQAVLSCIARRKGQVHVMEGSPPCSPFSASGKRNKLWGKVKKYSDTMQRTDDLFNEYARMVEGIQPWVFVAENVSGLAFGKARGYFQEIMRVLKKCGYVVGARMLDAQWLGVPQMRRRIIFMGVREDLFNGLEATPRFPRPLPYRYSVKEALEGIVPDLSEPVMLGPSVVRTWDASTPGRHRRAITNFNLTRAHADLPCPAVTATGKHRSAAGVAHYSERRKFTIAELKRICGFPDDFILTGTYGQQYERLGRSVPPLMMRAVAIEVRGILDAITERKSSTRRAD